MAIPDFQAIMLPLLKMASDGAEHSLAEFREPLANQFNLTEDERKELLPSGQQARFTNRVSWSKIYLERAKLLDKTRRGHFKISQRGQEVLQDPPSRIDLQFLRRFPEIDEFRRRPTTGAEEETSLETDTPEEVLENAFAKIRKDLAIDLLDQVKSSTSLFFERLVLELMLRMGYGSSEEGAGSLTSAGADEGIDGIISEDRLGLDVIYLQAKRWENTVGRPEIQKFVGALSGKRAKKGVFITTSNFSREARDYASAIDPKVILIDGIRLSQLMIDFNVGVGVSRTYEVKRIDSDYFDEE